MKGMLNSIKTLLSGERNTLSEYNPKLEFIKSGKAIRKELIRCRETGSVLGLYSPTLGEGMFLISIRDIITLNGRESVRLLPYDMNGSLLPKNELPLSEIKAVCPLPFKHHNPLQRIPVLNDTIKI